MMYSTQISYMAEAGRTTYEYRPRVPLFAPRVGLWCLITVAPLSIAAATALVVLDLIATDAFASSVIALTLAGTFVLYVLLRLFTRSHVVLSVTFDVLARTIEVYRRHARPRLYRCGLFDVTGFHVETFQRDSQRICMVRMERTGKEAMLLLEADERYHSESRLTSLADRLTVALDASQMEITNPSPQFARQQVYIPPTALRPAIPPPRRYDVSPPVDGDIDDERD